MKSLAVVIPTTHRVEAVSRLVEQVRATCPVPVSFSIVDNGPDASEEEWGLRVIVRSDYLGSEGGFVLGLREAPEAERYLLLDHDAVLEDDCLRLLLSAAGAEHIASANQGGKGERWDRFHGFGPPARDWTGPAYVALAPWSGLLLDAQAREAVIAQDSSGYFFGWDDYLACWRLGRAGMKILGVPGAVVWNLQDPPQPWRSYYFTRNHLLFYRDTRIGDWRRILWFRLVLAKRAVTARRLSDAAAQLRALTDGALNRRGPRMLAKSETPPLMDSKRQRRG